MSNKKLYYPDYVPLEEFNYMADSIFSSDWKGFHDFSNTKGKGVENYITDEYKGNYEVYLGELYIKFEGEVYVVIVESFDAQRLPKWIRTIEDGKEFIDIGVKQYNSGYSVAKGAKA